MSVQITIEPERLMDPRGPFLGQVVPLASRLDKLNGKNILLLDNGQLTAELATYGPIFQWFSLYLQSEHGATPISDKQHLMDDGKARFSKLADAYVQSKVDGAVIAICHAGVTQPSSLFAAELEKRGIPCVLLCTNLGLPLASATLSAYVPGLPLVLAIPAVKSHEKFGKVEAEAISADIAAGLTTTASSLAERFSQANNAEIGNPIFQTKGEIQLPSIMKKALGQNGETTVDMDPGEFSESFYESLCSANLCDGFPVIPPTQSRVDAMLTFTDLASDHPLVAECPPSGLSVTVRSLAVNAVMAGCRPEYFPILVAAFQAIADPDYHLPQATITTHPSGNALVVSGPLAAELGIHSGPGCLGPGFRANATIGRAVSLTLMNTARAIPGKSDLTVFGSPAEFTYCFAENDSVNPWSPLHTELYGPEVTSVTVHKCEAPHNVITPRSGPEAILRTIASTAATRGGNNMMYLGQLLLILNPTVAKIISDAKWTKQDVREFIFETARHPVEVAMQQSERAIFPAYFPKLANVPVMRSPRDVIIVVCGGIGPHAMVGVPWGVSQATSRPVALKNGAPLKSIQHFRRS